MSKKNVLIIVILVCFFNKGFSQLLLKRYDSIPVEINSNNISLAWTGGLSSVQVSNIDLDLDGTKDLFVFDKTSFKIKTFINTGGAGSTSYRYTPQYESKFPKLHDWAVLTDYNCDGKEDIFCYSDNGSSFSVYKNISSSATGLQFTLVAPIVYTDFNPPNGGQYFLFVNSASIPAISDIDNDGDKDVVIFGIGGSTIEYHLNKSKELYGTCDSLIFEVRNHCWGYAYEDPLLFQYTLHDTCSGNVPNPEVVLNNSNEREPVKHSSSCQLCLDLDNDGDKEFIVSNISFNNMVLLTNGGSPTASNFTSIDYNFPSNTTPINLAVFPCAFWVDVNNDGINDIIASPNSTNVSENFNSVSYYENIGTNSLPVFDFQQPDFLQDNMIDVGEGAYPALFDYDNDGLKDLFIGNLGYYGTPNYARQVAQFKNIGTASAPKFQLITRDYSNLNSLGISNPVPAFGDLDGDTDSDMIIGGIDGKIHYFQNTAAIGSPANFVLMQANFKNSNNRVIDVGDFAIPQIVDVDNDGKNDLVIGSRNGKIAFYKRLNLSGAPQMDSISHFWGNVNVTLPNQVLGFSYPCIYKNGSTTELIVGSLSGNLRVYNNIDGNINGTFNMVDSTLHNIYEGFRTAPTIVDINNDGLLDLFVGNLAGGLSFYKGVTSLIGINDNQPIFNWNFELYPNPADNTINIHILNKATGIFQMELYNALGQLIISEKINIAITLNTEKLKQGIYLCKVVEVDTFGKPQSGGLIKKLIIKR